MAKFKNESKLVSEQNVLALIDKLRANDELPASTAILLKNQIHLSGRRGVSPYLLR